MLLHDVQTIGRGTRWLRTGVVSLNDTLSLWRRCPMRARCAVDVLGR